MKYRLQIKCQRADFQKTLENKGYAYFTKGAYNLNIIGVRSNNDNVVTNEFDDALVLIYNSPSGRKTKFIYDITTEPGKYYMCQKLLNPKGTAILVPGQYRGCWQIAKHQGKYQALCQKKPVRVYRDNNRNEIYDLNPETIETGIFGINIHRSNEFKASDKVNNWSAGCQVFKDPHDFRNFLLICKQQAQLYGNSFTYTLINEDDLLE